MNELYTKLGSLLKKERERQEIKIEELSERLKISVPYLLAIEKGTTDGLPSELYLSLFAKSYSEALGIDYTRTVDAIKLDVEENIQKAESTPDNNNNNASANSDESTTQISLSKKISIGAAIVMTLFVLFFGINKYLINTDSINGQTSESNNTQSQQESAETKELNEAYNNFDWENKEYLKASKIILTLTPRKESWSAVFADGDTAIYRTLRVGRTYTAEADYRMIISVGVPSAVTIKLNGQVVDLRNKESKRVYKVKINQMNIDGYINQNQKTTLNKNVNKNLSQEVKQESKIVTINDSVTTNNNNSN